MKKKVGIIGLFSLGKEVADGQSIKTRIVADEIERIVGIRCVDRVDTSGWKRHPWRLFFRCINVLYTSDNIVFLTDAGGIKVFPWLLKCASVVSNKPIHYVVVGGWLINFIKKQKILTWFLKKLDGIYVETNVMIKGLKDLGFRNVYLMPNVKNLDILSEQEVTYSQKEPFRFCIFSRIMKEKGIEEAVKAINNINSLYGRNMCTLDLYGQVDPEQQDWFCELKQSFTDSVQYCGIVSFGDSVEVLKKYYALIFPTQFYTEGIPGTIIDAYAAGLPVVASEWESVFDIIDKWVTGITYPFDNPELLQNALMEAIENPDKMYEMKKNCLKKAEEYLPDAIMNILISKLK